MIGSQTKTIIRILAGALVIGCFLASVFHVHGGEIQPEVAAATQSTR